MTESQTIALGEICAEHFDALVGQDLAFANAAGVPITLRLDDLKRKPARGQGRVPFSLLFTLPEGRVLPDGLLVPQFGSFTAEGWFINRVTLLGGEPGVAYCEAVFA
jgi:hypothetical protein